MGLPTSPELVNYFAGMQNSANMLTKSIRTTHELRAEFASDLFCFYDIKKLSKYIQRQVCFQEGYKNHQI